jgi:hypothetical protein
MNLLLSLLLLSQDPPSPGMEWSGIDGFLLLLVREGFLLQESWDAAAPDRTLVIVFGEAPFSDDRRLYDFVRAGGRTFVASDRSSIDRAIRLFGVTLRKGRVLTYGSEDAFYGYKDCPLVRPRMYKDPFKGVIELAFNRPAAFDVTGDAVTLAKFPPLSDKSEPPCIVSGKLDKGSYLFVSDHSPFINLMLLEKSNLAFARNVLRWMERREVLFYYNGRVLGLGDLPENLPVIPPGSLRALNPALRHLELSGSLNQYVRNIWPALLGGLTLLALSAFVLWMFRRSSQPDTLDAALLQKFYRDTAASDRRRNFSIAAEELWTRVSGCPVAWPKSKWRAWIARRKYNSLQRAAGGRAVGVREFSRLLRTALRLSESGIVKWTSNA